MSNLNIILIMLAVSFVGSLLYGRSWAREADGATSFAGAAIGSTLGFVMGFCLAFACCVGVTFVVGILLAIFR